MDFHPDSFVILFIIPMFSVTVAPEWSVRFVDEAGRPVSDIAIDQWWKDYSLEWGSMHAEDNLLPDSSGNITLPKRSIRVSALQIVLGKLWDVLPIVTFHGPHGGSSFIHCRGSFNCNASFDVSEERPKVVVVAN